MRSTRLAVFVSIVQGIIFLGHLLLYFTWSFFWGGAASSLATKIVLGLLSVSFVSASFRGWYSFHPAVRLWYVVSAVWLGVASYSMWAAVLCWIAYGFSLLLHLGWVPGLIADVLFSAAILVSIYGLMNANLLRVKRLTVELRDLPRQWQGRRAALISDLHLGHVRNYRFIRRVVGRLARLAPDIVFIAGDLYDGTAGDFERLARPWKHYSAPLGVFYIAGNHEEFYSHAEYLLALQHTCIRVLNNEKVEVDGLQVAGIHYRDARDPQRYQQILRRLALDRSRSTVLLLHAPLQLPIAEAEGVSLQLSGHTHGGQFFPYTLIATRVWGKFIYGLNRLGNMQIYTSYGAGTWGPPFRVGTRAEIVLLELQRESRIGSDGSPGC
ncbi:MAG TPA: metallophosphoesterase [Terriglobales bacterium]|nr:metallophosphoesterase [Terriglobales bacterium]